MHGVERPRVFCVEGSGDNHYSTAALLYVQIQGILLFVLTHVYALYTHMYILDASNKLHGMAIFFALWVLLYPNITSLYSLFLTPFPL